MEASVHSPILNMLIEDAMLNRAPAIHLRPFKPGDEAAFRNLNEAWIAKYFMIEAADRVVLEDPVKNIIEPGGHIFMALADSISKLDQQAAAVEGSGAGFGASLSPQAQSLTRLNGALAHIYDVVSLADAAPTTQAVAAADQLEKALTSETSKWNEVKKGIAPLNQQLRSGGLPAIDLKKPAPAQAEDEGGGDEP